MVSLPFAYSWSTDYLLQLGHSGTTTARAALISELTLTLLPPNRRLLKVGFRGRIGLGIATVPAAPSTSRAVSRLELNRRLRRRKNHTMTNRNMDVQIMTAGIAPCVIFTQWPTIQSSRSLFQC